MDRQNPDPGDFAAARARFGGGDWIDLSGAANPVPWPVPPVPPEAWSRPPAREETEALLAAARAAYATDAAIVPCPGLTALIPHLARLAPPARVAIPEPTCDLYAPAFRTAGWSVTDRPAHGVTAAVIVNPNTPDGRRWEVGELALLAEAMDLLIIDETYMDPTPEGAYPPGAENVVTLRSLGKFHGLAGLRLGFALTGAETAARLEPCAARAISGPALRIGAAALSDTAWVAESRARLAADMVRLRRLVTARGWAPVGGTDLFLTVRTPDASAAQTRLAEQRIWTRTFPWSPTWLRLGLPAPGDWGRLETALP